MLSKEDEQLWKEYTKGVVPLKKEGRIKSFFSSCLFFYKERKVLPNTLDLHQMTLQEAFDVFVRFLNAHVNRKTKKITVITGRGKDDNGRLKKEFPFWMERIDIKQKISSFNMKNEGSFEIELRKKC